jgi:transposase
VTLEQIAPSLREQLERAYRDQEDPDVKERLFLVLRVKGDGIRPARASKELRRTRGWATKWMKRFAKDGIDGLRDGERSGRPPKLSPEIVSSIRKELFESSQGWKTEEVDELIFQRGGVRYHYTRVYQLLHEWGLKLKVPRKRHIKTASPEAKNDFKKRREPFWTTYQKASQRYPSTSPSSSMTR